MCYGTHDEGPQRNSNDVTVMPPGWLEKSHMAKTSPLTVLHYTLINAKCYWMPGALETSLLQNYECTGKDLNLLYISIINIVESYAKIQ